MAGSPRNHGEPEDATMVMMHIDRISLLSSKMQNSNIEDYRDYHEASVSSAIFNLSTTILGAEIMALPETMEVMGLQLCIFTIVTMGILNENSILIMLPCSWLLEARSYGRLMTDAAGHIGSILVQLCIIINNISILIINMIIISEPSPLQLHSFIC
uniref:Amino acid transporter transmembrane domain-containing protein n=1 Tax=Physcomitrium patens TaxID=3218 RepID=A0A2K1IM78_PHYPA|nr:hypothetical protein PHYPA_026689 [Physcomitrium patens]